MKYLLYILFLFFSVGLFSQANIFVSTTGDDGTGDGTIGNPYKTFNKTIEVEMRSTGYDTCFIRGGTYSEYIYVWGLAGSADADDPYVFMPYNGESVIIDGDGVDVGGSGSGMIDSRVAYTKFIDLEVMNVGLDSAYTSISGILFSSAADYSQVINCTVHDVWNGGINLLGDRNVADGCTVYNFAELNNRDVRPPAVSWNVGITMNTSGDTSTVKNCTVYDGWGEGISAFSASYDTIRDNVVYDVYSAVIYLSDATDCWVEGNFVYQTQVRGVNGGITIGDEGTGDSVTARHTVINNIVTQNKWNFYSYIGTELVDCKIANNTFADALLPYTDGGNVQITATGNTRAVFANNIIIQSDDSIRINVPSGSGITFNNNLYDGTYDSDATGANDVTGDPDFTETGGDSNAAVYYQLGAQSDAKGAGSDESVVLDFGDYTRDDPTSIGAWEYRSGVAIPVFEGIMMLDDKPMFMGDILLIK